MTEAALTISVGPINNLFFHAIPFLGAWITGQQALSLEDETQEHDLGENTAKYAIEQVEGLRDSAGLFRQITLYVSKNTACSSYGGYASLTSPIISIPQGLLTQSPKSIFDCQEAGLADAEAGQRRVLKGDDFKGLFKLGAKAVPQEPPKPAPAFRVNAPYNWGNPSAWGQARVLTDQEIEQELRKHPAIDLGPLTIEGMTRKLEELKQEVEGRLSPQQLQQAVKELNRVIEINQAKEILPRKLAKLRQAIEGPLPAQQLKQAFNKYNQLIEMMIAGGGSSEKLAGLRLVVAEHLSIELLKRAVNDLSPIVECILHEELSLTADQRQLKLKIDLERILKKHADVYKVSQCKKERFTAEESLFFIAREVANIRSENPFIRVVTKIIHFSIVYFILKLSLPIVVAASLITAVSAIYIISEKIIRNDLDADAVAILAKHWENDPQARRNNTLEAREKALKAGQSAIRKLIAQNVRRRLTNDACKLYITETGDNYLDPLNPFLTNRLARLNGVITWIKPPK